MEYQLFMFDNARGNELTNVKTRICNLNNLDSTARLVLHEMTQSVAQTISVRINDQG